MSDFKTKMHQIRFFSAGAPPQTPPALGSLERSPDSPSWISVAYVYGKGKGREEKGQGGEEKEEKGRKWERKDHNGLRLLKSKCSGYVVTMRPGSRDSGYQHCNPQWSAAQITFSILIS